MYGGNTSTFKNAKQDVIKHQAKLKEKVVEDLPHFDMRRALKLQTFTQSRVKSLTILRK